MNKITRAIKVLAAASLLFALTAAIPGRTWSGKLSGLDLVDTVKYDGDGADVDYVISASGSGSKKLLVKVQVRNPFTLGLTWATQEEYEISPGKSVSGRRPGTSILFFQKVRFKFSRKALTPKINWSLRID
jgi:hypothetical protein